MASLPEPEPATIILATYNVHAGIGADRRRDIERIAAVIAETGADIVGLQEVFSAPGHVALAQFELLARALGMHAVFAPTFSGRGRGGAAYGNALLSRFPVSRWTAVDLSVPRREPRNAIAARVEIPGAPWRVITTHFGLRLAERHRQLDGIEPLLNVRPREPTVLMGDLNTWVPFRDVGVRLQRWLGPQGRPATFPSTRPALPLDAIYSTEPHRIDRVWAHASSASRVASDHLPVCACLRLRGEVA